MLLAAGCSTQPTHYAAVGSGRYYDPRLGVYASPKLVEDGEPVPRGGGGYLTGRPYVIGGRTYYPSERPDGYSVVGVASWYGDAFHGRRTANGEIFDKNSISAAHPTLPLPSYVRVTNLKNGRSLIVRVNDRGPYHGGRVMDVSQRVAEALEFKGEGMARIKVDYVGRAGLGGSDDRKLLATLRIDGGAAQLDGTSPTPTEVADARPVEVGSAETPPAEPGPSSAPEPPLPEPRVRAPRRPAPLPPFRPYDVSEAPLDRRRAEASVTFGGPLEHREHTPAVAAADDRSFVGAERFAIARRRPVPRPADDLADAADR